MSADVSVIIAERDSSPPDDAISCALAQEGQDVEVVVLSPRPRRDLAERERVTHIQQASHLRAAFNIGARVATGEWIAFLDADDRWAGDHLARIRAGCERTGSDFGCCAAWVIDDEGNVRGFHSVPPLRDLERALLRGDGVPSPSALLVRRAFWERAGGFDDWLDAVAGLDLCIRWSRIGRAWVDDAPTLAVRAPLPRSREELAHLREEVHELERRYGEDARALGERFGSGELAALLAHEHMRSGQYRRAALWVARNMRRRSLTSYLRLLELAVRGRRAKIAGQVPNPPLERPLGWDTSGRAVGREAPADGHIHRH